MADDPVPHWQPLTALPLIASLIDGELADAQEHQATLLSVRDRPYVLDDDMNLGFWYEIHVWNTTHLRVVLNAILALAEELQ